MFYPTTGFSSTAALFQSPMTSTSAHLRTFLTLLDDPSTLYVRFLLVLSFVLLCLSVERLYHFASRRSHKSFITSSSNQSPFINPDLSNSSLPFTSSQPSSSPSPSPSASTSAGLTVLYPQTDDSSLVGERMPKVQSSSFALLPALLSLVIPVKRVVWDPLCAFVAWVVNIAVVVCITFLRTLIIRRTNLRVCVSASTDSSNAPHSGNSLSSMHHAEATQLSRRKHSSILSPFFSALVVPSTMSCSHTRKSLVLDLDETLVHSQFKLTDHCDLRLDVRVDDFPTVFYVSKRPYLDVFLRTVAQWYDVIIFTASLQKYGDPLITVLDVDRVVKRRIFRQHCVRKNGNFVKDLTIVNPNLADVIIIDNSPAAYSIQPSNAIPIEAWYNDQADEELLNLLPLLHALAFINDVRSLLDLRLTGGALVGRKPLTSQQ